MKRTKRKLKTIALGVLVAAGMLLPCAASAQSMFGSGSGSSGSDGFFKETGSQNRTSGGSTVGDTYGFANEAGNGNFENYNANSQTPLGGGLAVLTVLGAGYAVLRRRKNSL